MGAGAVLAPYGGQYTPLLAQAAGGAAVGIRLSGLSSAPTHTTVDQFTLEVSNLSAAAIYQVVVSSSNATALGLGGCGTASQTETVTGVAAQTLTFFLYVCTEDSGTLTAELRRTGASTAEAAVTQRLSVVAIPDEALADARGAARNVARSGTPGIVSGIHFDGISTTSFLGEVERSRRHRRRPADPLHLPSGRSNTGGTIQPIRRRETASQRPPSTVGRPGARPFGSWRQTRNMQ